MKLSTMFRPFTDAEVIEGRVTDRQRDEWNTQVRQARLELARSQRHWTEIAETRLVRRGPFVVDSETDAVFVYWRGQVFESGRATVGYVRDDTPMIFTVDRGGEVIFLERHPGAATWSEIVARKARR